MEGPDLRRTFRPSVVIRILELRERLQLLLVAAHDGVIGLKAPKWKKHADVRTVMQQRLLSVSIIQAVNRIRCRKVINEDGERPASGYLHRASGWSDGRRRLGRYQG